MLDYEKSNVLKTELYKILDQNTKAQEYFDDHYYYFFDDYKKILWRDVSNVIDFFENIDTFSNFEKNDFVKNVNILKNMDQLDGSNYVIVEVNPQYNGEYIPLSEDATKNLIAILKKL